MHETDRTVSSLNFTFCGVLCSICDLRFLIFLEGVVTGVLSSSRLGVVARVVDLEWNTGVSRRSLSSGFGRLLFGVLTTRLLLGVAVTSISGVGNTRISSCSSSGSLGCIERFMSNFGVIGRTIQSSSSPLQIGQSSWSRFDSFNYVTRASG